MAYCVQTDVESMLVGRLQGATFGTTSKPTATQVTAWISQISDEIDNTIRRAGWQVPDTTNGYLTTTNSMGVAYLIEYALNVDADGATAVKNKMDAYQNRLKDIFNDPRMAGAVPAQGKQNNLCSSDMVTGYVNPTDLEFTLNNQQTSNNTDADQFTAGGNSGNW